MSDRRNQPAMLGAVLGGVAAFVLLLWLGLPLLLAWLVGWTVPAFALYGIDKAQSERGGWRVPEVVLHGLALVGGVFGAWAGRMVFHHKTQKPVFTLVLVAAGVLWALIVAWSVLR